MIEVYHGSIKSDYKIFTFPVGESQVVFNEDCSMYNYCIVFDFEQEDEVLKLLLVVDAIRNAGGNIIQLSIPYVPYSRQDRVANTGECFSLRVFASIINSLSIPKVVVYDAHSDVTTALINNVVEIKQHDIFKNVVPTSSLLISPDGGALKKIYKLAKQNECEVVECSKIRDTKTGNITGVKVHSGDLIGKDCYIVDDICDGGRTFIEIAKELKKLNCGKVILCVTHGFFTKGIEVFDGLIDEIYTRKGKVK